jgi:hypothetical protein
VISLFVVAWQEIRKISRKYRNAMSWRTTARLPAPRAIGESNGVDSEYVPARGASTWS